MNWTFQYFVLAAAAVAGCPGALVAQTSYQTDTGEMLMFHSSSASQVVEKVRAKSPGVMVEVYVKPGDTVTKGQILGHTELDAAKLQLDLAKSALDNKSNVKAAEGQAEAWTIAREETEESARHREVAESRVEWATAMEKMYLANHETQLEVENVQEIQYQYAKQQYENRFFRAPVSGKVSEALIEVGKPVTFATHAFTVSKEGFFSIPVTVPATLADSVSPNLQLPIRSADGKSTNRAMIESVSESPLSTGEKVIKLLVEAADFPASTRAKLKGMKFDVLLPQLVADSR